MRVRRMTRVGLARMDTYILVSETSSIPDSLCHTMYSEEIGHWLHKR